MKFWPFPSAARNYPNFTIEYGFKVLQHILRSDDIFQLISNGPSNENDRMDILFGYFGREKRLELREILRKNWKVLGNYLFCFLNVIKLMI